MHPARQEFDRLESPGAIARFAAPKPETLYFDFKEYRGTDLRKDKDHQKLLAKALSGFANAAGGLLVIGVDDKRRTLAPLADARAYEAAANELFSRLVAFPVEGVETKMIEETSGSATGFVLIFVPPSELQPHRSEKDKRYYRRSGDSFRSMEHYEVADAFGRRHHPRLRPRALAQRRAGGFPRDVDVDIHLGLVNAGRVLARYPLLRVVGVQGQYKLWAFGIDGNRNFGLPQATGRRDEFRGDAGHVIHAGDKLEVCRLTRRWAGDGAPAGESDVQCVLELEVELAAEGMACTRFVLTLTEQQQLMAYEGSECELRCESLGIK